jgi:TolA-binding protein
MKCWLRVLALLLFLAGFSFATDSAQAQGESDRLWLVGSHAYADRLYPLARRVLERLVERHPGDARAAEATLLLGKARLALDDLAPALESFRQAQRFTPPPGHSQETRFWEGETLFRMKRYKEARAAYEVVLNADAAAPDAPNALYGIAWSELELGRLDPAAKAFRKFLEAWPEHPSAPEATVTLARTLVNLKRYSDAVALLTAFVARHPGHRLAPDAAYLLGWSEVQAGKLSEGIRDLRKFLAAHPQHELASEARRAIVDALLRQGNKAELSKEYDSILKRSSPAAEDLYDAGVVAKRLGRERDKETAWKKLRSEFPDHALTARASLELAQAAFKKGQFKETATLARAAAESEEPLVKAEGLLLIGESHLKSKRFQEALKAFKSAAEVRAVDGALHYRALAGRGLAHEELRQWAEAAKAYEAVSKESPDKTLQKWAKERLAAVKARLSPLPGGPAPLPKPKNSSRS